MLFKLAQIDELVMRAPVGLEDVRQNIKKFYRMTNKDNEDAVDYFLSILEARIYFDSARIALKNLIQPEESKSYLRDKKEHFLLMNENLGRYAKRLDEAEKDLRTRVDMTKGMLASREMTLVYIKNFVREMMVGMEALVIYPLKTAWEKYWFTEKLSTGETVVKDKDLFLYFVFLYLFHASTSLGTFTQDDKNQKEMQIIKEHGYSLSEYPANVRIRQPEETQQIIQDIDVESMLTEEKSHVI